MSEPQAQNAQFLPIPVRKKLNVPKLKSSQELTVLIDIHTVLSLELLIFIVSHFFFALGAKESSKHLSLSEIVG